MSTSTSFVCSGCSRKFKGSAEHARRGICPECDAATESDDDEADSVAKHVFFNKVAALICELSQWGMLVSVVPLLLGIISLIAEDVKISPVMLFGLFAWLFGMSLSSWLAAMFIRVVVDIANNLQKIVDRK